MASLQKKTVKGIDYWYLVESKRVNGKPKKIIIEYFGNTKKFSDKIIEYRDERKILKSYTHGDTFALLQIAKKLKIEEILDTVFKDQERKNIKRSRSLLIIALQRACKPSSKNELHNWFELTTLPYEINISPDVLTSQHFWEQMDEISEDQIMNAEDTITKAVLENYDFNIEKIALDYTNYFSYIDSKNIECTIAQRGHNKQKRYDLRQYSMALITTKDIGLPLCSHIYEGNTNDQTEFLTYFNILKKRIPDYDPKKMTVVFDGGSNNKTNLNSIETFYICSFSLSYCKQLYDYDLTKFDEYKINKSVIKAYRTNANIWNDDRDCIITFSNDLFDGQLKELNKNINEAIDAITLLNSQLNNKKSKISKSHSDIESKIKSILSKSHLKEILQTEVIGDQIVEVINCSINCNIKNDVIYKYFGKKLLITNRVDWSTYEILKTYREQDCIEKIFRDTKNFEHFSIRPQYHFTNSKIRVHIFCSLLGLTLATLLHKEVVNRGLNNISKSQLLDTLSQIRKCWIKDKNGNNVSYVLEEMSDVQAKVWDIVNSIR
jgi:transposase